MKKSMLQLAFIASVMCLLISCVAAPVKAPPPPEMGSGPSTLGYLAAAEIPSSLSLLPPPPATGSLSMLRDEEVNRSALALRGSSRWELATRDADLTFPAVAQTFSCAVNVPISEQSTPKLLTLLQRAFYDAGRATGEAKQHYQRKRPFMVNGQPICTPEYDARLRVSGSYPSGHTSVGWTFGLVLTEVSPDRANEILSRARAFGQSRLVCNVHWQSDVDEGRIVASAVFARLNAEAAFRNDVAAARAEVAALHAKDAKVGKDCDAESQILKTFSYK